MRKHLSQCSDAPAAIVRKAKGVEDDEDDGAPQASSQETPPDQAPPVLLPPPGQAESPEVLPSSQPPVSQTQSPPVASSQSSEQTPQTQARRAKRKRGDPSALTDEDYANIEADLGRLFFAHGLSFSTAESIYLQRLIKRLVPAFDVAKIPSGYQMGNRVLKAEYDRVMVPVRAALAQSLHISVYVDGWKAHNDEKVFTLVASGDGADARPVSTKVLEEDSHNAEEIRTHLHEMPEKDKLSGLVCDGDTTTAAGCKVFATEINEARGENEHKCVLLICSTHTLNRVLNDAFGVRKSAGKEVKNAFAWLVDLLSTTTSSIRNVEALGKKFAELQVQNGRPQAKKPPRPTLTRWTSSHECWKVMCEAKTSLILMNDDNTIAAQCPSLKELLDKWDTFAVVLEAMAFVSVAINLLQGNKGRAGMIIPIFSAVEKKIIACAAKGTVPAGDRKKMRDWAQKAAGRREKYESQDWLCAATVMTPVEYSREGAGDAKAFFEGYSPPAEVEEAAERYVKACGGESSDLLLLSNKLEFFSKESFWKIAGKVTPEEWWTVLAKKGCTLARIAIPIVAIRPSTAEVERTFSSMGWLSGGRRCRLSAEKLQMLSAVHSCLKIEDVSD